MAEFIKVRSYIKDINQTPRKVSLVASLVKNRLVADALVILSHTPKRPAKAVIKAIESAQANAISNAGLDSDSLIIKTISVTTGTRLNRYKPASRGRALPFQKKNANILVEISGLKKEVKKSADKSKTKVMKKESK